MKILIDLDGIVCDSLPRWLQHIADKTGVVAQMFDITDWELTKCPPLDKVDPKAIFKILETPGFTAGIQPFWGAVQAVEQLVEDGHEVMLVTARHGPVSMPETLEWVQRYLPFLDVRTTVVFCHNKELIPADVIIDDRPETLVRYREAHPRALVLGIEYPYNKHLQGLPGIRLFSRTPNAVLTWGAIYGFLSGVEAERRG